ncbi:MAG: glycosyl transferase [Aeromicrobium sp.]|nr:glycosyl transferase [Aeromicrobium sp.]
MSDVVVLRALGLGDALAAVPALRALRRGVGRDRIVLAGPPEPGRLLVAAGVVDAVRATSGLSRLDVGPVGLAVNLHGRGPESHRLLRAAGAAEVVAFVPAGACGEGPTWCDDEPERDRWCRLVASRWDVPTDPDDVRLHLPGHPARARGVLIHPGAAAGARRWPVERWAVVARALTEGADVTITGTAAERPACLDVAAQAGLPRSAVTAGSTTLEQLTDDVRGATLVLSGDTGVAHLAYACGTPSVTLFGPTPPRWWGPPATGPHLALWHGTGPVDPHGDRPDPALLRITPAEVVAAARAVAA